MSITPDEEEMLGAHLRMSSFRKALQHAVNEHSMENGSNTPDHILAGYLADCLAAFDRAMQDLETYRRGVDSVSITTAAEFSPTRNGAKGQ